MNHEKEENIYCEDDSCVIGYEFYTCPMHPEIHQHQPGSCPKCGMALEAVSVEADDGNEELNYMSKRFWVSVFLSIPVF